MTDKEVYSTIIRWATRNGVDTVPIDVIALCERVGVKLLPLSELLRTTGLSAEQVFRTWGNKDGVTLATNGRYVITYNDFMPHVRRRFTICEELSHIILGHLDDADFEMFSQKYSAHKYQQYEHEAKLGASVLLCPPKLILEHEYINADNLPRICRVSSACAARAYNTFNNQREDIRQLPAYAFAVHPTSKVNLWKYRG